MCVKKILCGVLILCCSGLLIAQQQVTKFAVVDTARVYEAYFRDTGPVRNYEAKKAEFQKEINKQTAELQKLQQQRAEYRAAGNEAAALRLDGEITKKTEILTEYTNAKNIELDSLLSSLQSSDAFYKKLYAELERIAEAGGYSMILSLQNSDSILWYSPTVDITDQVISTLGLGL